MSERSGHVVVCGLEGLSIGTIEELQRMGEQVLVVAEQAEPRACRNCCPEPSRCPRRRWPHE